MLAQGFLKKFHNKLSGFVSISMLATLLPGLVVGGLVTSSAPASANLVVDAANATFDFSNRTSISGSGTGKTSGDVIRFNNVLTVSGISIDAVVTTTITNVGADSNKNVDITQYDNDSSSSATVKKYLELNVSNTGSGSDFNGYINLNFKFYENGTYTGTGTGNPITLQNVSVFSLDVDSGLQFTDFKGFQKYYVNNPTRLRIAGTANPIPSTPTDLTTSAPYFRFLSGDNASGSNDPEDSVQVEYLSLTSLDARVGNATSSGGAYFAIGFGQWDWNGGTAGLGTPNPVNNPANAAPTSSNYSLYVPATGNFVLEKRHFGSYADTDGNAFDKVQITALPTSGTLQKLSGGTWVSVTLNDYISVSSIDAGELRLVMNSTGGTADTNMQFKVNDSLVNSSSAYTLTLNVVPTPQTITFPNPGTKALNATVSETATATSGLATTLTSLTTGVCTISNGTITNSGTAGACTVTATQDGNSTYSAAPSVTQTFYYSAKTAQTITYVNPTDKALSSGSYTDVATASSNLTVTLTSLTPSVCTVSGFTVTLVSTGTCQLRASQAGDSTYAPASPVTRSFNVSTGTAQTITFAQPADKFVNETFTSGATADSGLTVTLASSTTGICTVSGLNISTVAVGTCTIVASQGGGTSGGTTYAAATNLTRSFTVTLRPASAILAYRIDFDTNSGSGYMNPQYAYIGSTVVLEPNLYKKDGYTFAGWNTKADGSGTQYADKGSFKIDSADVRLYAQWKLITIKPTITWTTPAAILEGTPLSATQLNALASVPGTYTYSPATAAQLPVGKHTLKVTFVPTDPKFETIETTVEIEVLAKPKLTWATPAAIVEGTALSATQLNALATVPGTYSYSPALGTTLPAGKNLLKVTFTPTDTRLPAVTAEVSIDVSGKPVVVPGAPVDPAYSVTGNPKSTITWGAAANATSYVVQVDGKNACSVTVLTCEVARLLGPKNNVNVTALGTGGSASSAIKAAYVAPTTPQVLTVVNFDTARAVIKSAEAKKLRAFANQINASGFTTLTVFGHTDSVGGVDNQKLSVARANSTIAYLKRLLPNVKFVLSGFAAGEPVADNSTPEGKAANRRAEVFIP
jgi:uncharacterized repeat protein (TIGR02543 family)